MKQRRIPGIVNLFEVSDPSQIKALANDPVVDRFFDTRTCPINWFLLKRSLTVLSFKGQRFPTMAPRLCEKRARAQDELWRKLNDQVATARAGPIGLAPLAEWVKGVGSEAEVGILAQQVLGRSFRDDFTATPESWAAALVLVAAPRSPNLAKVCWWFITGKVRRAKGVLAKMVGDDLSAVNAIGIAVHNLAKSLRQMRLLYADIDSRKALSAEAVAEKCLRAPVSVYRQSTAKGTLNGTAFPKSSLLCPGNWQRQPTRSRTVSCIYGGELEQVPGVNMDSRNARGRMAAFSPIGLRPSSAHHDMLRRRMMMVANGTKPT